MIKENNRDKNIKVSKRSIIFYIVIVASISVFIILSSSLSSSFVPLSSASPMKIKQIVAHQQQLQQQSSNNMKIKPIVLQQQQSSNKQQQLANYPQPSYTAITTLPPPPPNISTYPTKENDYKCQNGPYKGFFVGSPELCDNKQKTNTTFDPVSDSKSSFKGQDGSNINTAKAKPEKCKPPQTTCGNTCIDTSNDPLNCGGCGVVCQSGTICAFGTCTPSKNCPSGTTLCPILSLSSCVDLQNNPNNCGVCGKVCNSGACSNGQCVPKGQNDCAKEGKVLCNGQCEDPSSFTTNLNCGECGITCETNASCFKPKLDKPFCSAPCPSETTFCGFLAAGPPFIPLCANTKTDRENCGGCAITCQGNQICDAGKCTCPDEESLCGNNCKNLNTDSSNCGSCGNGCILGTQTCTEGKCVFLCPSGQTFCGEGIGCKDLSKDPDNCGTCGRQCGSNEACVLDELTGFFSCQQCPTGTTRDSSGICQCTNANQELVNGQCVDKKCTPPSTQQLQPLSIQKSDSTNVATTATDNDINGIVCNGQCIDPNSDNQNCGECGNVCPAGISCNDGTCGNVCPAGTNPIRPELPEGGHCAQIPGVLSYPIPGDACTGHDNTCGCHGPCAPGDFYDPAARQCVSSCPSGTIGVIDPIYDRYCESCQ